MESRIQKNRIISLIEKFDKKILQFYLENGPRELKKKLDIGNEEVWQIVFDYLMFEKEAVKVCVKKNADYIKEIFVNKGPEFLRNSFNIMDSKYDDVWEYVMDFIGVSHGAIYEFVNKDSLRLKSLIRNGKAGEIREILYLNKRKYNKVWEEILDLLLECISFDNFTYNQFEQGLRFFTNLYNNGRKHRGLRSFNPPEAKA